MRALVLFGLLLTACSDDGKSPSDSGKTNTDDSSTPTDDSSAPTDSGPTDSGPTDSDPPDTDSIDEDDDGYLARVDCDDTNPDIHPGADELCDGVDQDCDGELDNGVESTFYADADADGFGDAAAATTGCEAPAGTVADNTDCDDADPAFYPGASEADCTDPNDYNCDGSVGYADNDGDGFAACSECDDDAPGIFPTATETCNGIDDNCDGSIDENTLSVLYADADGDGYGDPAVTAEACEAGAGWVADNTDCDDTTADVNPGLIEACDGLDNNCDGTADDGVLSSFYMDTDGDGFGDPLMMVDACAAGDGLVTDNTDCDDTVAGTYPGATEQCDGVDQDCDLEVDEDVTGIFYADADGDGYGDTNGAAVTACEAGVGEVTDNTDCDDADASTNPGITEACDDPTDRNCDGSVGYADADSDGVAACEDCDDNNAAAYPGADERCDAADNDCDGTADEDDAVDATTWYFDADGDSYGGSRRSVVSCTAPTDYVAGNDDCDDLDVAVSPAAAETCDGVDNNCDGSTDGADATDPATFYADTDGDGFGTSAASTAACVAPDGYVSNTTDCDDNDANTAPGADERCDGLDNDCDGSADEGTPVDAATWYMDADDDGSGNVRFTVTSCEAPVGYVVSSDDCDDLDPTLSPDLPEICDGDDDDCDTDIDEDSAIDAPTWYLDSDVDTYGDPAMALVTCYMPADYVADGTDCDDTRATRNPGEIEACDLADTDEDCDGLVDDLDPSVVARRTVYPDADGDTYGDAASPTLFCDVNTGYTLNNTDCDDTDGTISPGGAEVCDAADTDEDCDGLADDADSSATGQSTYFADSDEDGYGDPDSSTDKCDLPTGYTSDNSDCEDSTSAAYPGNPELCDGYDNDCNGSTDEGITEGLTAYFVDADDDGFGDENATEVMACVAPVGYRLDATDCDDGDRTVHPYAWESTTNLVDDNCDGLTDTNAVTLSTGPTSDDSGATITGISFPLGGTTYTTAYAQSNGRITFSSSDTDLSESATDFYSDRAIAVAWDDLNPASSSGGEIYYLLYPEALVVYWDRVPEYGSTTSLNTMTAILFTDGRVILELGTLGMTDGLVGWSVAPGSLTHSETDLSAAMGSLAAGRWGLGTGTEQMLYELFVSDNDLDNTTIRLCPYQDGIVDLCAE